MKSLTQRLLALVVLATGLLAAPLRSLNTDAVPAQLHEEGQAKIKRVEDATVVEDTKDEEDWVAPEGVNTYCHVM